MASLAIVRPPRNLRLSSVQVGFAGRKFTFKTLDIEARDNDLMRAMNEARELYNMLAGEVYRRVEFKRKPQ